MRISSVSIAFAVALVLAGTGCKNAASEPDPVPRSSVAAAASAAPVDHFGEAITAQESASLVDVAKNPGAYKGKTIVTTGKVTRVCQERGCWMAIKDSASDATVRMHGHSFFVPTTSSGREARVQGTVMMTKDGHECDEMEAVGAQLEIDATGVELGPPRS
jgi:hypothetical protein